MVATHPPKSIPVSDLPQVLHHWTKAPAADILRAGGMPDTRGKIGAHHPKGIKTEKNPTGKIIPDHVFCLSLDDSKWWVSFTVDTTVPARKLGDREQIAFHDAMFYDAEQAQWMVRPHARSIYHLCPVPYRLKNHARILDVTTPELEVLTDGGTPIESLHQLLETAETLGFDAVAAWTSPQWEEYHRQDIVGEWISANTLFVINPQILILHK